MKLPFCLITATFVLTIHAALTASEVSITLPTETPVFKPVTGVELAMANCLTCHSSEYVAQQPAKARDFWEATVKKMIEKYGAPIIPDTAPQLIDYLTAGYGQPAAKP